MEILSKLALTFLGRFVPKMDYTIDTQLSDAKAVLERIRTERRKAQSEHHQKVFVQCKKLSKGKHQLAIIGKRSRLHYYMDILRSADCPPPSLYYTWQIQSQLCMALHNLDVKAHQQTLLEQHHMRIVRQTDEQGSVLRKKLEERQDDLLLALVKKLDEIEVSRGNYEKTLANKDTPSCSCSYH